jgi:hypothetical protein
VERDQRLPKWSINLKLKASKTKVEVAEVEVGGHTLITTKPSRRSHQIRASVGVVEDVADTTHTGLILLTITMKKCLIIDTEKDMRT